VSWSQAILITVERSDVNLGSRRREEETVKRVLSVRLVGRKRMCRLSI
jgi:hypothetical protein